MKTQQFAVTRDRLTTLSTRVQVARILGIARKSSADITRTAGGYTIALPLPNGRAIKYVVRPALPPLTAADREARAASIPSAK